MLFDPTNPANKFGYFKAGKNFCSYSQHEAQEYAAKTGEKVEWNFNDEFFSAIDWTIEPTESLKELYAERARQLRNKYDYLVLTFSGGSDSHNILSTFYENNIYIDEILTHHVCDGVKDKLSPVGNMIEITLAAIPEAKRYIEKFPTTIHRVVDISELIKTYWSQNLLDLKFNFIYYNNYYITPYNIVATSLPNILPEYQKLTETKKSVCFIHGNDKPYIEIQNGKWFFSFTSSVIDSSFSIRRQFEKSPVDDELFYWSPDAWKIMVKQAHVLRRYLYDNREIIKNLANGVYGDIPSNHLSRINFFRNRIPTQFIKNAIYPYWRNEIVDIGKVPYDLYGVKSLWWTNSNLPATKEHMAGVQYVSQIAFGEKSTRQKPMQISYDSKKYNF